MTPDHDARMADLETEVVRLLLADAKRDGDVVRQMAVLTILVAKLLCALADADGVADRTLLGLQIAGLRDAVRLIREREPRRAGAAPVSARVH
jgi:hypothetical protein